MSARRARGLVIAALAALLAGPPSAGAARDRTSDLAALADSFVTHRLARAPYAARRADARTEDLLAPRVAAATLDAERAWLRDFRRRVADAAPEDAAGPPGASGDVRALLLAAVRHDSLVLERVRPFERDPGAYVTLVAGSVAAALDRTTGSRCGALKLAVRRLREVPEVLRAARVNLRNPPRVLSERAIERFRAVLGFYRRDVPRLAAGCRQPQLQADLAEAESLAIRSVEAFLAYLEQDLLPASRGKLAIGAPACRLLIGVSLMAEVAPVESLLAEATRQVDARRAELDSLAARVSAGGTGAALDSLAVADPADRDPVAAGRRAVARVRDFLRSSDLVTLPPRPTVDVRRARAIGEPDDLRLAEGEAGDPRLAAAWLEIAPADSAEFVAHGGGRWERDLAAAAEGIPGRLLREASGRGSWARLGLAMADVWDGTDWGVYCERLLVEVGYGDPDPRYRLALAARALRVAGRSLASLALHAGAMTPDEARRMLEDRCLLAPARAEREMRWAASRPALMGYTLDAQRLLELQDEAARRLGPQFRIRWFNDAVLRCGVAPYGFVRARVAHELAVAAGDHPVGAKP